LHSVLIYVQTRDKGGGARRVEHTWTWKYRGL
jgi:hypothetical protein